MAVKTISDALVYLKFEKKKCIMKQKFVFRRRKKNLNFVIDHSGNYEVFFKNTASPHIVWKMGPRKFQNRTMRIHYYTINMTRIVWFCPIYSVKPNRTIARTALCESALCEDLL